MMYLGSSFWPSFTSARHLDLLVQGVEGRLQGGQLHDALPEPSKAAPMSLPNC